MADAGAFLTDNNRSRQRKDRFARYGVIAGGISVLLTLVLIFFYLLYVIVPVFAPARITPVQSFSVPLTQTAAVRFNEQNTHAFHFSADGQISLVALGRREGQAVAQQVVMANPTSFDAALPNEHVFAYGDHTGGVTVVKPLIRQDNLVLSDPLDAPYIQLDSQGMPLVQLAVSVRRQVAVLVGVTQDQRLVARVFHRGSGLDTGEQTWQASQLAMPAIGQPVTDMVVTPDGRTLYVLNGRQVTVIDLNQSEGRIRQQTDVSQGAGDPVAMTALSGANSLLITGADGKVTQWFEVASAGQRQLTAARTFSGGQGALNLVVPEYYRKGFFAVQDGGLLAGYYMADSAAPVLESRLFSRTPELMTVSPRADRLLAISGEQWQLFKVTNPYPEVSFSSLWQKVWYEGYPEPDYVWQSTSGTDESEPKLSLVPVVFGTLKAAFYALCFAIPLALAGAIYTAYFMSSSMRKVVKPTIEIMEALPTVILGFLAGIWLAPIVENHLIGMALSLLVLPLVMVAVGLGWAMLPGGWQRRMPTGLHILLLMPTLVLAGYLCFTLSPVIEQAYFGGDIRSYLTNHWGIGYDQRNALVVGIAMGFAVIPTIFTIAEDAIYSVPAHLSSGSLALGATPWQTLTRVVLLTASPGIFSAVMMGLGRAVGETMIVLMATGNTPIMDWNILEGLRTLSATIAIEMPESEVGSAHYRVLFLAAFVLFVFTFFFNTLAEIVRQRLREKYKSL
ncbi:ABC transporter permease subunit [Photobacterium sp. TLY01]|uniref:ABC transporter permease subunit n=1 Tax=Photobacterium sp. TLY01 TaxID=2907534 RepID=UPI001F3E9A65|nr:ABC transporter permease subunit [Photobacterium sp. TLY01]UIP27323.1 ABC transporter permease subunit [Photobacterium sp. TLY01]